MYPFPSITYAQDGCDHATVLVHVCNLFKYKYLLLLVCCCQKPEDWLDDEPEYVPDPNGIKPDDWDEEEDGEWEAPQVGELI